MCLFIESILDRASFKEGVLLTLAFSGIEVSISFFTPVLTEGD
jgi:hypothetical protein